MLNSYLFEGTINQVELEDISKIITKIIEHPKLTMYYQQNNQVNNERPIITTNKEIVIPDRIIFNEKEVVIIDYKTGKPEKKT